MAVKNIFERAFNAIPESMVVQEKVEWSNGTGYYDGLCGGYAPTLKTGAVAKFMSANNRRVIVVGTPRGNLVVFDRYSRNDEGQYPGPCVINAARRLEALKLFETTGGVSERDMYLFVGYGDDVLKDNIGFAVQRLIEEVLASERENENL